MANKNEIRYLEDTANEELMESFDLDELEEKLESQLENEFADLDFLQEERDTIGNPDALGKVVLDEVWKQFGNQIGLDMTAETLIQKYDREHPETYEEVGKKVMQDERYKDANKQMKQKQQEGNLRDEYTGKKIKQGDKANLDHTVSRKELFKNKRRKQANIATEDLANKKENLNATNESLNKSKKEKSVKEMIATRKEREEKLREQNERANKKIDESNMSETEKRIAKEENNKRLQDKRDAKDELMTKKDVTARKAINKDIAIGVAKETGKKAGKDALKVMVVEALRNLLKEIMNGLIRFLKEKAKSFKRFLEEMKEAIKKFFENLKSLLRTGVTTAVGTIVSEIFGPIVSLFSRVASLIKQGFRSLGEAIAYLTNKENRDKPFSIKVAEVGKIIVAGLGAMGAIFGGELIEKALIGACPVLQTITIPLLGSLPNIIGIFLASMIAGVATAVILNLIDKAIAKKQNSENTAAQLEKGNEVLSTQRQLQTVSEVKVKHTKTRVARNIYDNHVDLHKAMPDAVENIRANCTTNENTKEKLADIDKLLDELKK